VADCEATTTTGAAAAAGACALRLRLDASCDTVTVSGSSVQSQAHGTYKILESTCNDLPQYKCDDCDEKSFLWYSNKEDIYDDDDDNKSWFISRYGCDEDKAITPYLYMASWGESRQDKDGNIAAGSDHWEEWVEGEGDDHSKWEKNKKIKVECAGD